MARSFGPLLAVLVVLFGCSRDDSQPAPPKPLFGWLCGSATTAPPDAAPALPPATAATCTKELRAAMTAATDDPKWPALYARATAECAHACDRDPKDADTCAVLDRLVLHQCEAVRNGGRCAKMCETADSPSLRTAMCKHAAQRAVADAAGAGRRAGDRVIAKWTNGRWYPGTITKVTAAGTFDVLYDDGDRSRGLSASRVRDGAPPKKQTAARSTSRPASTVREGASCAGPGWRHVCGGVCTDIKEDNNHCGGCGNRCGDGYHCDGSGTCRDASGRL
jgi:hypothetical protein